jgi:hypothetical protein
VHGESLSRNKSFSLERRSAPGEQNGRVQKVREFKKNYAVSMWAASSTGLKGTDDA